VAAFLQYLPQAADHAGESFLDERLSVTRFDAR
jgi:hypothetical protein